MELNEFVHTATTLREQMLHQAQSYLCNTDDAEDVVQEALAKLWMMREDIDDTTKVTHLASVIVKNASLNALRNRKTTVGIDSISSSISHNNAELQLEEKESRQRLKQAIKLLPDKQRAIVRMRNVEQLSYAEIAQILGSTESSVRVMICKARATLMKQMKTTI